MFLAMNNCMREHNWNTRKKYIYIIYYSTSFETRQDWHPVTARNTFVGREQDCTQKSLIFTVITISFLVCHALWMDAVMAKKNTDQQRSSPAIAHSLVNSITSYSTTARHWRHCNANEGGLIWLHVSES